MIIMRPVGLINELLGIQYESIIGSGRSRTGRMLSNNSRRSSAFQSALYSDLSFSSESYRYGSFSTVRVAEVFREKLLVPCDENN